MDRPTALYHLFIEYLQKNTFVKPPHALYRPIDYILQIGGKRIRPLLLLMGYELFDDDVTKALPAALAIEVFHNFTLVHDDIMDEAPLRRGKPTVHTKYDTNTAILSGDVMLIYAYEYLMKYAKHPALSDILSVFNEVAIKVCEGQQYDMDFENREDVHLSEYMTMIEYKTAYLLYGALKIGAMIANASEKNCRHVAEFGRNIGIAFQIQDDILDTYGNPEKFGKKVGGDIIQNKKTFLVLKALEIAEEETKKELLQLFSTHFSDEQIKIEKVKTIFNHLKIQQIAAAEKEAYQVKAFEHLNAIELTENRKDNLRNLALKLIGREA